MMTIGYMQMPADFKYASVFLKGKPRHSGSDRFCARHPAMDRGQRAKIFSPFDALRGFGNAVASKDALYVDRPALTDEETAEIDRRLGILSALTANTRKARQNSVRIRAVYFAPCADPNHEAYGRRGQLVTILGICRKVDGAVTHTLTAGETVIPLGDILSIDAPGIFDNGQELDAP